MFKFYALIILFFTASIIVPADYIQTVAEAKTKKKRRKKNKFDLKLAVGPATFVDFKGTMISADGIYKPKPKLMIPFGFSQTDLSLHGMQFTIKTFDFGIGYNASLSKNIRLPFGTRLGYSYVDIEGFNKKREICNGHNLAPHLGLGYKSKNFQIGFESRMILPCIRFGDTGDDDDDDDSNNNDDDDSSGDISLPTAHMLTIQFEL